MSRSSWTDPSLINPVNLVLPWENDLPPFTRRDTLFSMATPDQPTSSEIRVSPPAWLEDAAQCTRLLGRLVQDPSIQAALILRGKELWAQAGELLEPPAPERAAVELAQKVYQYWSTDGSRDLTRYVRLTAVAGEFILYATGLSGDMVLAILYNEETPFSKMRLQAAQLAHTLLSSPVEDEAGKWIREYPESAQEDNSALEAALTSLPPLFDDVPPPTVPAANSQTGSPQVIPSPTPSPVTNQPSQFAQIPSEPAQVVSPSVSPETQPPTAGMPSIDASETISSTLHDNIPLPGAGPFTRPAPSISYEAAPAATVLPSPTPALSDLYLAVVLLPRLPKHHLIGDLAVLLPQWIAQTCVAHGWRLEAIRVRPDYVQWVVNIPPATSASQHLRLMRRLMSQYIFAEFPTLARENPSGEFWASGYLVTSNSQLPAENIVQSLISQVRQQQGIGKSSPEQV
jgi:REP element-mobilizing transposase RayT